MPLNNKQKRFLDQYYRSNKNEIGEGWETGDMDIATLNRVKKINDYKGINSDINNYMEKKVEG